MATSKYSFTLGGDWRVQKPISRSSPPVTTIGRRNLTRTPTDVHPLSKAKSAASIHPAIAAAEAANEAVQSVAQASVNTNNLSDSVRTSEANAELNATLNGYSNENNAQHQQQTSEARHQFETTNANRQFQSNSNAISAESSRFQSELNSYDIQNQKDINSRNVGSKLASTFGGLLGTAGYMIYDSITSSNKISGSAHAQQNIINSNFNSTHNDYTPVTTYGNFL